MSRLVSIIVTAHNYAQYLPQALDSALAQTYETFEVIVVNDGSTDNTAEILSAYAKQDARIKVVTLAGLGLAAASNRGITAASGEYVIRLDADDYFDENILLVEANYLDRHPDVGLVYCDYYTVSAQGEIIHNVRRAKVEAEVELLDRPALAAGAMYRKKCYEDIGGYNESIQFQEDYDFWLKFIEKYSVSNVSVPLMYYRQHQKSMSRNWTKRMQTRRLVKQKFVEEHRGKINSRILAVVPARADMIDNKKMPLLELAGKSLLRHCVEKLHAASFVDRVIVSTDDREIASVAQACGGEVPYVRSPDTSAPGVPFESVLIELIDRLKRHEAYQPDIIVIAHAHSPFITAKHIEEAIYSMEIFNTDSVIGVVEDLSYHWRVGRHGLEPVGYQKRVIRQDKDTVYKEAGGLYVVKTEYLGRREGELLGQRVGNIELASYEALRISQAHDYWVAQQMMEHDQWHES